MSTVARLVEIVILALIWAAGNLVCEHVTTGQAIWFAAVLIVAARHFERTG